MDCPVLILLAALVAAAWTLPTDKGPQTFQKRSPKPEPNPKPQPEPKPQTEYQEVIAYLTPSQISQLEQTQENDGMILKATQDELSQVKNQNEAIEQYLLKQQVNKYVENSKDLEQYLKLQDSSALHQQLLKQKARQLKQKQQTQQEAGVLKQQQLKEQEQQYLKQQNSRQLKQWQEQRKTQSQAFEQQYQKRLKITQYEQQLLNQRSKELEELFIKEQEARELEDNLQKQKKTEPQEFSPYWYLQQLQNSTEQINEESSNKLQQKYVISKSSSTPFNTLAPQIVFVPQQDSKAEQVKPVVEEEPQLQYVYLDANGDSISIPLDLLRQQPIKPIQERPGDQAVPELNQKVNAQDKLRFFPYQYIPEQQDLHLQIGKKILEKQLILQEHAKKELETGLKLNQKNKEVQKLGQQIYEHQILLPEPVIRQFELAREPLKLKETSKLKSINQEEAEIENNEELTELQKDTPTLQEFANFKFIQKLRQLNIPTEDYLSHLDLINQQNKIAKLKSTIKNKDQKFTPEELETAIINIQQERQKLKSETINTSQTQDAKTTKPIKVETIKWEELPPSYPFTVPEPYVVKVPVDLINRYAVKTK